MLLFETLYLLSLALLATYGVNSLVLTWLYGRPHERPDSRRIPDANPDGFGPSSNAPLVTVQVPVYNERYVVERVIHAAANLSWPAERLQIQVLDDSTDDTSQIIAAALEQHREKGIRLDHVRRTHRLGFKAGALQNGLTSAIGEFIAIFDADFIPPSDFLQKTISCFGVRGGGAPNDNRETVGCVQARWGHANPDTSLLTRIQALGIDGHFVVEQTARDAVNAFLNFNGTAGVWRRACVEDAGGWQGDTLTEDLDLSYRAQLRGWRILYQPEVVVPAELPVQVDGLKRQQFRWAKGSMQVAKKLLVRLWRSPQPFWRKLLGTLHITNYAVHPLMLMNLLLILPMTLSHSPILRIAPFFMLGAIGPPLKYWVAMRGLSLSLPARLGRLGMLVAGGFGLSVRNTGAVLEALLGINSQFKRTPKFAVTGRSTDWHKSAYKLPLDRTAWIESILALYAFLLLSWSVRLGFWWLAIWLIFYAAGYGYIATLSFVQAWRAGKARSGSQA